MPCAIQLNLTRSLNPWLQCPWSELVWFVIIHSGTLNKQDDQRSLLIITGNAIWIRNSFVFQSTQIWGCFLVHADRNVVNIYFACFFSSPLWDIQDESFPFGWVSLTLSSVHHYHLFTGACEIVEQTDWSIKESERLILSLGSKMSFMYPRFTISSSIEDRATPPLFPSLRIS